MFVSLNREKCMVRKSLMKAVNSILERCSILFCQVIIGLNPSYCKNELKLCIVPSLVESYGGESATITAIEILHDGILLSHEVEMHLVQLITLL